MAHLHRFYVPEGATGECLHLPEAEAHHALKVVRLRTRESVECFDGIGNAWQGTFEPEGKREALVRISGHQYYPPDPQSCTLMVAALHRGGSMEDLLRRGTEIGVGRFLLFRAQRSERPPKLDTKWERILVETCKQCGRNWLPEISVVDDPISAIREHAGSIFVAAMTPSARPVTDLEVGQHPLLVVGPEGDFEAEELARIIEAGAQPLTLGHYTYRTEVAAVLGATLLLVYAGAFR